MGQNLFSRFRGKTESNEELDTTKSAEELSGNSKEALWQPQIGSLATSNRLFGDSKEALWQRIKNLEARVKALEEQSKRANEVIEQLLATKQTTASLPPESPSEDLEKEQIIYLSAPTQDGIFTDFDDKEQMGKSIYRLVSSDGQTGTFAVLNTIDAVSTAVISISRFIKPACKIENTIESVPSKIVTTTEGEAHFNGEAWTISRKATVRLE